MSEPLAQPYQHFFLVVAVAVALLAALFDWRRGEIPNWLTYGALIGAPLLHVGRMLVANETMDAALAEGGYSVGGAFMCALVPAMMYRQGALGGGDLKLLAGLGALLGTMAGVEAEMYGLFAAALVAPAKLAYDGKLIETIKNAFKILANMFLPKAKRRPVEETALSWFRLGPPVLFGVALTAYLRW